jgi:ATP-binding cassette subfamily F protein 3
MFADTEKVLKGLGFTPEDFQRQVKEFSSGWQMRVELAKILLQKPDVILLDEPTNHLDIESIQWIEDYLINYSGAVVIVSHDRAFLDNITQRTIEISLGKTYDYKANYSEYVALREERVEQQMASYNNQQKEIKDIELFIERFRYKATKARQVQSRIKRLNKIDIIEIDDRDHSAIHFRFPPAPHAGVVTLEAKQLFKKYDQKPILNDLNFQILKGEKIAFVGRNGEGKTTLTKIITGETDFTGEMKLGHNVSIGYYAQNQSDLLNPEKTVFATIDDIAIGDIRKNIRTILGSFLFSGETIDKKVKVLSGGEKSRLALAKLLLTPVNLLILDEPTNHLDMTSKDILKSALLKYDGTLIVVSHDRDFLQGLTDKIFEFKNHSIKEFIGDIYEFLEKRKLASLNSLQSVSKKQSQTKADKKAADYFDDREKKKAADRELKKLNREIQKCETDISKIETELEELDKKLIDTEIYKDYSLSAGLIERHKTLSFQLEKEMNLWEKLNTELTKLNNSL